MHVFRDLCCWVRFLGRKLSKLSVNASSIGPNPSPLSIHNPCFGDKATLPTIASTYFPISSLYPNARFVHPIAPASSHPHLWRWGGASLLFLGHSSALDAAVHSHRRSVRCGERFQIRKSMIIHLEIRRFISEPTFTRLPNEGPFRKFDFSRASHDCPNEGKLTGGPFRIPRQWSTEAGRFQEAMS